MSEHFFGLGRGKITKKLGQQVDGIAKSHGAEFIWVTLPGDGPRFWFACDNIGEPFDSATAKEVLAAVRAAGLSEKLWPDEKLQMSREEARMVVRQLQEKVHAGHASATEERLFAEAEAVL